MSPGIAREGRLAGLAERVREIEWRGATAASQRRERIALPGSLPGDGIEVETGALHEWFGLDRTGHADSGLWLPPLSLLASVAARAIERAPEGALVAWIGRWCWPYPRTLAGPLLPRSVFLDTRDAHAHQWALEVTLRSPGVAAIVADGRGLSMAATRRVQLAAREGGGVALLARPARERDTLSAATTRWRVDVSPSAGPSPRWIVELLRCKGRQPAESPRVWTVERDRAQGVVAVPANLEDRPRETPACAIGDQRSA